MSKTKIFVISDLHFGHAGIIKMCSRPFKNVEDMNNRLIDNWNSVVSDNDIVYLLGDFSYKGKNVEDYLNRLNGKIVLIKGNHDRYIRHPKIISTHDYLEVKINDILYIMSHYPMTSWNHCYRDSIHLYGHVHTTGKTWEFVNLPNAHSVCCEFHNFTPVDITKFKQKNFAEEIKSIDKK